MKIRQGMKSSVDRFVYMFFVASVLRNGIQLTFSLDRGG